MDMTNPFKSVKQIEANIYKGGFLQPRTFAAWHGRAIVALHYIVFNTRTTA